jgi:hypothetical protein
MTSNHPCLACRLPDCDETDRRCSLKQAIATYQRLVRHKAPVPTELRVKRNLAHRELYVEANSRSSAAWYQRQKSVKPEEKRP